MRLCNLVIGFILFFTVLRMNTFSQDNLVTRDLATNLDTPWEILWGPDNYIWMTERYGRVSRVNPKTGEVNEILRINDVVEDGERGLMGMAFHPQFIAPVPEIQSYPYVYLVYNYGTTNNTKIKVVRYKYLSGKLDSAVVLLQDVTGAWNHDGSRLWIDPEDWTIYVTIGDAANTANSQNLSSLNGKILRMNLDGTIPKDNPFGNSYVWSYGHRNPQGLVFAKGKIYSSEHGPSNDDELNIIEKGRNYGWPNVEGFCDKPNEITFCEQNSVVEPIAAWTPVIAPAGIDFYNHNEIEEWKNSILLTSLRGSKLIQIKLSEDGTKVVSQKEFFSGKYGRLRDVCISPEGKVYLAPSNRDGRGSPSAQDDRIIEISNQTSGFQEKKSYKDDINLHPNPFSGEIFFYIDNNSSVTISIYNLLGEKVKEITNLNPGINSWDGKDENGMSIIPGLYFAQLKSANGTKMIKLVKE
jgi:aldose sugar dehydrogenase